MDDSATSSLEQIRAFLSGSGEVRFTRSGSSFDENMLAVWIAASLTTETKTVIVD